MGVFTPPSFCDKETVSLKPVLVEPSLYIQKDTLGFVCSG